jgi:predicted MFS family arabinose efflux permease
MKDWGREGERSRYRWAVLFASFYAFIAFAFAFQEVPPLFDSIREAFGITNIEAGLLMSVVLLPGVFLSLPAGLFVEKYGVRRIGFASLACVSLGCLLTATAGSFLVLLVGRLILGLGGNLRSNNYSSYYSPMVHQRRVRKGHGNLWHKHAPRHSNSFPKRKCSHAQI